MPGVGNGMVDLLQAKDERRRETGAWWDGLAGQTAWEELFPLSL